MGVRSSISPSSDSASSARCENTSTHLEQLKHLKQSNQRHTHMKEDIVFTVILWFVALRGGFVDWN